MMIVPLDLYEFKRLLKDLAKLETTEEKQERLQKYYDDLCIKYVKQHRIMIFIDDHGNQRQGRVRFNGKGRNKTIIIDALYALTIRMRRVRCDELGICVTLFPFPMIPRTPVLLTDIAKIALAKTKEELHQYINAPQTPVMIRRIQSQWSGYWKEEVERRTGRQLNSTEDIYELSRLYVKHTGAQIFQSTRPRYRVLQI